jgi:DNA-binding NarL/FixJ family response regulator
LTPRKEAAVAARTFRVLIVADVRLYREGLSTSLATRNRSWVVTTSSSHPEAREKARAGNDVVVVDIAMRNSLELIRDLRQDGAAKVLAFAVEDAASVVLDCAEAGAAGYVPADASLDDLVVAIERIAREELFCSPRVAAQLFRRMSDRSEGSMPHMAAARTLTIRERQVLDLIRQGLANKEIADRLSIAEPTVKTHVHNLLEKLNVSTRAQAAFRPLQAARRTT